MCVEEKTQLEQEAKKEATRKKGSGTKRCPSLLVPSKWLSFWQSYKLVVAEAAHDKTKPSLRLDSAAPAKTLLTSRFRPHELTLTHTLELPPMLAPTPTFTLTFDAHANARCSRKRSTLTLDAHANALIHTNA